MLRAAIQRCGYCRRFIRKPAPDGSIQLSKIDVQQPASLASISPAESAVDRDPRFMWIELAAVAAPVRPIRVKAEAFEDQQVMEPLRKPDAIG
jgi:hypothetical protein